MSIVQIILGTPGIVFCFTFAPSDFAHNLGRLKNQRLPDKDSGFFFYIRYMELNEEENITIKRMACAAWSAHYNDLGIYRWIVRHRHKLFALACAAFLMGVPTAFGHEFTATGKAIFVSLWAALIAIGFFGAADHIYIAFKIKRVQTEIQRNGIFLTKNEILFYCRDLIKERT